jgi:hypothetical protein
MAAGARFAGKLPMVVNFVLFQLAWFACILSAAHGRPWLGTLCVAGVAAWHVVRAVQPRREAALIGITMLIGLVLDGFVVSQGVIRYTSGQFDPSLPPHWIIALWALLATTLNLSLGWLKGRWWLAALMGAVAAPLSYAAGVRMGAASLVDTNKALALLAIGWAFVMPLLMRLAERFDGISRPPAVPQGGVA